MTKISYARNAAAALYILLVGTCTVHADGYTILNSNVRSIVSGQKIEQDQVIRLESGEAISFTIANERGVMQRQCSGPYAGTIHKCTNESSSSRVGIPGGARGSDDD